MLLEEHSGLARNRGQKTKSFSVNLPFLNWRPKHMLLIDFRLRALNPSYLFVGDLICRVINVCKDLHRDAQYVVSISADIC